MRPLVMPPAALGASWCRSGGVSSSGYSLGGEKTERGLLLLQVITLLLTAPCAFLFVGLVTPPELGSLGPREVRASHAGLPSGESRRVKAL